MSGQYAGAQRQRSVLPIVVIVIGVIALLIGGVTLAVAAEAKPTLENALADPTGDLLTQEAYERTRNFGIAVLVIGALCIVGGIVALTRRSSPNPAQPQPVYYAQPQQPVHHAYQPQPQPWAPPPAPPPPPPAAPGAWQAPPPDASQRVG